MTKATIVLNKDVTVMEDLGNGRTAMFKLDKVTVPHVNEVARLMARDLNYGTKSFKRVVDRLRDEYGPEYALWVAAKAMAVVGQP